MTYVLAAYAWVCAHQSLTVEIVLMIWGLANVAWAQWPKPHSAKAQSVWKMLHSIFQLIVTHASAGGTFTWPWLVRSVMNSVLGPASPDPFGPVAPAPALPASSTPTLPDADQTGGSDGKS